jgi:hypothetical protein
MVISNMFLIHISSLTVEYRVTELYDRRVLSINKSNTKGKDKKSSNKNLNKRELA